MDQTGTYINIMQQSLERKLGYLNDILGLSKQQEEIVNAKKFDETEFENIVDQKEILINNVNEIDKGFASVYDRVRVEVLENKELFKEELLNIQLLIKKCVDCGVEIEAVEGRNKSALERYFSAGFKGIKQMKQSKKVASKYYQSMSNGYVNDSMLYDTKK